MKPSEILKRLLGRIEEGAKTPASALLYAQEYDRLHGTDVARRLERVFRARAKPVSARTLVPAGDTDESAQVSDTSD